MTEKQEYYGVSIAELLTPISMELNFLRQLSIAEPFTRERILWLMMQN